jgi:aminoglycoside phosphotransferase (APT) family kinase protein
VLKSFYRQGRKKALKLDRPDITPAVRRLASALDRHADTFYREFEAGPLTLLHGDSHLGNTYRLADGRAGLLDWQVVWHGPGLREISYFITAGLEPEIRRTHERELVDRYLEALRSRGVDDVPSSAEAFDRYRLFAAEAWDATAMTIAWPGLQAPENMEAGWRRASLAIEDNDVASAVERTARA